MQMADDRLAHPRLPEPLQVHDHRFHRGGAIRVRGQVGGDVVGHVDQSLRIQAADSIDMRRGWVYTAWPSSRAKPTRVRLQASASEIASTVGAETAASSAMPAEAAFIAIS